MAALNNNLRTTSFGQDHNPTIVDRFGTYLSTRRIRSVVETFAGRRVADVGCGYHAAFSRTLLDDVASLVLADVSLHPSLKEHPRVQALEGALPEVLAELPAESCDVVLCNSVLEHLWDPQRTLAEFWRLAAPGGVVFVNVPSWRGKRFLELSAYRLNQSPAVEIDDHKAYYDPRDLWPMLVKAGFSPRHIKCAKHKWGLNTFAVCRKLAGDKSG
jgi:2-polyprenyl-3-methyl-5-hydroxy-6-metoxy-1,4-benzoquinol methylase